MDKKFSKPTISKEKVKGFPKSHPIIFNLLLVVVASMAMVWLSLIALDIWTDHGHFEVVPSVKGLTYNEAIKTLKASGMQPEIADSIYDSTVHPGTVLEQSPRSGTKVKANRTVYLTVTAFTPKMITMPRLADMSVRQARSTLEGLGITHIIEQPVESEYKDLVLGVKFNGIPAGPGTRVPASATITLEVGMGYASYGDSVVNEEVVLPEFDATDIDVQQ